MMLGPYRASPAKGTGLALTRAARGAPTNSGMLRTVEDARLHFGAVETPRDAVAPQSCGLPFSAGLSGLVLTSSSKRARPSHILMSAFIRSEERRVGKECRSRWS